MEMEETTRAYVSSMGGDPDIAIEKAEPVCDMCGVTKHERTLYAPEGVMPELITLYSWVCFSCYELSERLTVDYNV